MRLIYLVILIMLVCLAARASDENGTNFKDFTMNVGDTIVLKDYRIEMVEVQSLRDGIVVVRVSTTGGSLDEQRALLEGSSNSFEGGPDKGGIAVQLVEILDEQSSKIRIEYPEDLGTPRKRSTETSSAPKASPNLMVTESFDSSDLRVGDDVQATIKVKNVGSDTAYDIELGDRPPLQEFVYKAGYPPKINSQIDPGKSDTAVYYLSAVKEGKVTIPSLDIKYSDSKKNIKTNSSEAFSLTIEPARRPDLKIVLGQISPMNVDGIETLNVTIMNTGDASASDVVVVPDSVPSGIEVSGLDKAYFEIAAGKSESYSANIKAKSGGNYTLKVKASFQSGDEAVTIREASIDVVVLEREYKYLYYLLAFPVALIAFWVFKRYKEYKY
jgi:hypothetical protein